MGWAMTDLEYPERIYVGEHDELSGEWYTTYPEHNGEDPAYRRASDKDPIEGAIWAWGIKRIGRNGLSGLYYTDAKTRQGRTDGCVYVRVNDDEDGGCWR